MTETELHSQPYSLSRADYVAFYLATCSRAYVTLPWGVVNGLVILAIPFGLAFDDIVHGHYLKPALIFLAELGFFGLVIPALGIATMLRNLARTRNAYVPRSAVTAAADFSVAGDGFSNRQAWHNFRRVRATGRAFYLMLSGGTAFIVLKSAFATAAECDAFIAACRQRIAGAKDHVVGVFDAPMTTAPLAGSLETPPFRIGFRLFAALNLPLLVRIFTRPTFLLALAAGAIGVPLWQHFADLRAGDFSVFWLSLPPALTTLAVLAALLFPALTLLNWLMARNKPAMRHPRRLAMTAEKLRTYGEGFDISVDWPVIKRIGRRFGALYFWTRRGGAFVVPLSAFASPEDARAFQDQATAWHQAALRPPARWNEDAPQR